MSINAAWWNAILYVFLRRSLQNNNILLFCVHLHNGFFILMSGSEYCVKEICKENFFLHNLICNDMFMRKKSAKTGRFLWLKVHINRFWEWICSFLYYFLQCCVNILTNNPLVICAAKSWWFKYILCFFS